MVYELSSKIENGDAVVCIVGLGYVGLPLAEGLSKHLRTIGFDINPKVIERLNAKGGAVEFTCDPSKIKEADFIAMCVPTPVLETKEPDMRFVESASRVVGENLKEGATVVLESTVYPGTTDEIVVPILEKCSGMVCGQDFKVGYSPERLSPGDDERTLQKVVKVVSGMDDESADALCSLYSLITKVYKADSIKVAEAAKVIENTQRDLNIALFNELAIIFQKMGIDSDAVFEAAATKWNFHRYVPGLVGGHCIPVDPYYLVYKAHAIGHHPQVILAGREVNDNMASYVANQTIRELNRSGKSTKDAKILVMGITYKENVSDVRSSPAFGLIDELKEWGAEVLVNDPCLDESEMERLGMTNTSLDDAKGVDCIIVTVPHKEYLRMDADSFKTMVDGKPIMFDIKRTFSKEKLESIGFKYLTL